MQTENTNCAKCGAPIPPNANFCGKCGAKYTPPTAVPEGKTLLTDEIIFQALQAKILCTGTAL